MFKTPPEPSRSEWVRWFLTSVLPALLVAAIAWGRMEARQDSLESDIERDRIAVVEQLRDIKSQLQSIEEYLRTRQ